MATLDQLRGCVLGQCAGDALGFPVEGMPPEVCADHVERVVLGAERPTTAHGMAFGQYTDDSQLMRELLQSFVVHGGFDPADYGRRIGAIFEEDRIVGRGAATERAAERLFAGKDWRTTGEPAPIAGNGSAMRAGIVGLLTRSDDALVEMAVDQGRMTHADPRCSAGALAIAAACARGARRGVVELEDLSRLCAPVDEGFAEHLLSLKTWVKLPPAEAVGPIASVGRDFVDNWQGISPFVVGSVLWSLYAFLRHPDEPMEAIGCAIAVGGDVDTTGAMTGAIAGATHGAGAIPEWIKDALTDRGAWGRAELEALAAEAHAILAV